MMVKDGDYQPDGQGGFLGATGREELLGRVLFKLTARRGAFPLMPHLGSRLYLLPRAKESQRGALALQYVQEALSDEEGLRVLGLSWEGETLLIQMTWQEESLTLSWPVERM